MKKKVLVAFLLLIILSNLAIFASCSKVAVNNDGLSIKESAIIMSNDVLSNKLNADFKADVNKELYDFTNNFNYLYCYNKELDYYAIYNMDSGKIMERSNGNVYEDFLDFKCYYGGYGSYFYEKDNIIYSVTDNSSAPIDDAITYFNEYSSNLMQASIEDSQFKSRENIKTYVEDVLYQDGVVISKCGDNRNNAHLINDDSYSSLLLANNVYYGNQQLNGFDYCIVDGIKIGFSDFGLYDGAMFYDTLFPINAEGSCGLVAATMLLQYYERNELLKTISLLLYSKAEPILFNGMKYKKSEILSEIVHSELIRINGGTGAGFIDIKNTINSYFSIYQISGLSATSSIGYAGIKSAIDNDDPCIVDIWSRRSFDVMKNDLQGFIKDSSGENGHVMYAYGYTLDNLGVLDEFICHTGWHNVDSFKSCAYVSKLFVEGNVRLLY